MLLTEPESWLWCLLNIETSHADIANYVDRQRRFRSPKTQWTFLTSIMLKKMRRPKVTVRSVSPLVTVSIQDWLTWVSSFNVSVDFHHPGRYLVVLVVGEGNKGDRLRRSRPHAI